MRLLVAACAVAVSVGVVAAVAGVPATSATFVSGTHNGASSFTADAAFPSYSQAVLADGPLFYHRMNEAAGATTMVDAGTFAHPGTYGAAINNTSYSRVPGAPLTGSDAGMMTDGSAGVLSTEAAVAGPNVFSLEIWFSSSSTSGGQLVGFGNKPAGPSTTYGRRLYLDSGGRLSFGEYEAGVYQVARTAAAYNDGAWHHVVATMGGGALSLYVDGALQASGTATTGQAMSGYWRVGGDVTGAWPNAPASGYVAAFVDNVAIYTTALSAARVAAHRGAADQAAYQAEVTADSPYLLWTLDEMTPDRVADASGNGRTGAYHLGPGIGNAAGALPAPEVSNGSTRWDGARSAAYNGYQMPGPTAFTIELWFRTTTRFGGKLVGFGSSMTGSSGTYDRHVYMRDDGRVVFGVYPGTTKTVISPTALNNGAWHHVAASLGAGGLRLYVDGALVASDAAVTTAQSFTGYWRFGYDNLNNWPGVPVLQRFTGHLDEIAVFTSQLTTSQIQVHYAATK